jgi:peptide/nickel transport system permease protein
VTAWLARRLAASIAIVFAVVTLTFVVIHLAHGAPWLPPEGQSFPPEVLARLRAQLGLDQPLPVQYGKYLQALLHGELGQSFGRHRPVADALREALPNTLLLAGAALLLDFGLGLALLVNSMPTFWLGLVLLLVLGRWFPLGGKNDPVLCPRLDSLFCLADLLWHLVLPALTLGLVGAAGTARYQRAALLEVLGQDFIRTARAKGLRERRVLTVHALRNALLPLITLFGLALPFLLTGAVLVEQVFAWPGMGRLAVQAIGERDYPVVTATALVASMLVVLGSFCADLLYAVADPRIRVRGE